MNSVHNYSNNNINFAAKMDISKIKTNKSYWKNLSEMFEQSTKQYPNDTIIVRETKKGDICSSFPDMITERFYALFSKKRLAKLSDKKVISMFKKILKANHDEVTLYKRAEKFANTYKINKDNNSREQFWDIITAQMDVNAKKTIGNDSLLLDVLPYFNNL